MLGQVVEGRYGPGGPREILTIGEGPFASLMDPAAQARFKEMRKPLEALTPVTEAMLRNPSPNDWLMWRGNYQGWGYSALDQINRDNVKNLTVAWTWAMNSTGMTEFTPLVHDGIMFVWNYGELIQALDARNGNLLWRFRQTIPADYSRDIFYRTKRSLAIGGNKLIVPTTDMHLIALDIKTGEVVWDVVTDDFKKSKRVYNGGPLVVKDKVIMGASGCAPGGVSCFVTGHDLATGKELWRFNTVAQPGEPGNETWNGVPPEKRWGASVWIPPSYDPELNLVYIAVGSPFPWSSVDRGTYNPKGGGKNGDSLYTNSTLAINPDTGKLVWHYQHLPNDTFDQDYAFERVIAPVQWRAGKRKAVITAGKPGVIEALDAATGQFLFAKDPGAQNIFTFNEETGVKTLMAPGPPDGIRRCPSNNGARNFLAGSYDPNTNRYYLSINDVCTRQGRGPAGPDGRPRSLHPRVHHGHQVAGDAVVGQAHHRRRPAVLGRGRSLYAGLRRPGRQGTVEDAAAGRAQRLPDHLYGRRQTVRRDGRRQSRAHRQRRAARVGRVHAARDRHRAVGVAVTLTRGRRCRQPVRF